MTNQLFRVENIVTQQGLWYNSNGDYTGFITRFDDAKCRDVPMEFDEAFRQGGNWLSACDTIEGLRNWFSQRDLQRLEGEGYRLYRFITDRKRVLNGHDVFLRNKAVATEQIDLSRIYGRDTER